MLGYTLFRCRQLVSICKMTQVKILWYKTVYTVFIYIRVSYILQALLINCSSLNYNALTVAQRVNIG